MRRGILATALVVVSATACSGSSSPASSVAASQSAPSPTGTAATSGTCSPEATAPSLNGHDVDVSGQYVWRQFGAAFYVAQVGTCVYSLAENVKNRLDTHATGTGFADVFVGDLSPNLTIHGSWGDVPLGSPDCCGGGTLTWKVTGSPGHYVLVATNHTGNWGTDSIVETRP